MIDSAKGLKASSLSKISRRKAIGIVGLGILASQFPMACTSKTESLTDSEKQSIHYLTLTEVAVLIKSGKITSEELTQLMLSRIAQLDGKLNSYITVLGDYALQTARALDQELAAGKYRGPLHGVPIGIKDLLYTTHAPTTASHSFNSNFIAPYNATVVDKLTNAGAVILGKLNLTEGAMGNYPDNWKIPKNPWGDDLWTGVSSSGSGVATAAGLCFGAVGSDTGGSIRFPAMANGIVGLKPTYGLVSKYGVMPLAPSLDHVGPMTRSTLDAAIMLEAMSGYDANDPGSLQQTAIDITTSIKNGIKGLRIGVDRIYMSSGVDPLLVKAIDQAIIKLEELGATIISFSMPDNLKDRGEHWWIITSKEAYEANKATYPSRKAEYTTGFAELLEFGWNVSEDQYKQSRIFHEEFKMVFRKLLSEVDAFVSPAGGMAKGINDDMWRAASTQDVIATYGEDLDLHFGSPANFAGVPTLTLPCGKAENGFPPPGFQLIGAPLTEAILCRIGYAYEQATEWYKQHPSI